MKADETRAWLMLAAVAGLGWLGWRAYRGAADAAAGVGGAIGRGWDAIAATAGEMVDSVLDAPAALVEGRSIFSDPAAGGFVKEAAPATVPNWSNTRNIDPLMAYFSQWGNTAAARAEASRAGWTDQEIAYAVAAWAANQRQAAGDWY